MLRATLLAWLHAFYQMLSGQPPFSGDGPGQMMGQHLFKPRLTAHAGDVNSSVAG